jgi:hypothetical protein
MDADQVPLIWTAKGNLPIASLQYRHEWSENDNEICFVEEYSLDGEVVKRSVHLHLKQGCALPAVAGGIG